MRIALDAGHNPPKDWGAICNSYVEYAWNRRIATETQILLKNAKHNVYPFCGNLVHKISHINKNIVDVAIEIHHNANSNLKIQGAEVLYYPDSFAGKKLAEHILEVIGRSFQTNGIYEGFYQRDYNKPILYFLEKTQMPAVIVECAYLSSNNDRHNMSDDFYVIRMARRIVEGIEKWGKSYWR